MPFFVDCSLFFRFRNVVLVAAECFSSLGLRWPAGANLGAIFLDFVLTGSFVVEFAYFGVFCAAGSCYCPWKTQVDGLCGTDSIVKHYDNPLFMPQPVTGLSHLKTRSIKM